jgi:membrane-associated PAP2 superfamily phosphatase
VKHVKLVILLCGLVGLAELILPLSGGSRLMMLFELDALQASILLAVFALPTLMAGLALVKPPLQPWQAGVALAGFALGAVKFQIWNDLPHLTSLGLHGTLAFAAIVVGVFASALALLKPEAG